MGYSSINTLCQSLIDVNIQRPALLLVATHLFPICDLPSPVKSRPRFARLVVRYAASLLTHARQAASVLYDASHASGLASIKQPRESVRGQGRRQYTMDQTQLPQDGGELSSSEDQQP